MNTSSLRLSEILRLAIAQGGLQGGAPDGDAGAGDVVAETDSGIPPEDLKVHDEDEVVGEPEEVASESGVKAKGRILRLRPADESSFELSPEPGDKSGAKPGSLDALLKSFDDELEPKAEGEPEFKLPEGTDPGIVKAFEALNAKLAAAKPAPEVSPEVAQWQQRAQQVEQWASQQVGQLQQELITQRAAQTALQAQLSAMVSGKTKDPAEMLQDEWLGRAESKFKPLLDERDQRIAQLEAKFTEAAQRQEREGYKQRFSAEADSGAREIVLKGFSPEAQKMLGNAAGTHILSLAATMGTSIPEAAKMVRQSWVMFARELIKANAQGLAQHVAKAKKDAPPAAAAAGKAAAAADYNPSDEEIDQDGRFKDRLDWEIKGKPRLKLKRARQA